MSNVLDLSDQVHFLGEQATGTSIILQCVWVYEEAIDLDGLRRFHHHLQRGRLGRRIERSPVPFGRHRWVSPSRASDLEIAECARPREEFDAWLTEQANFGLDCERGPEWHLAVLPFADGGAGVSLVISHCLTDGVGLCEAVADAASGRTDGMGWPAAASRPRWRALRQDIRQTARDLPDIGRAVIAAIGARRSRPPAAASATAGVPRVTAVGRDEPAELRTTTVFVDADEWDARATALGGTSNTLLAGVAARLAESAGRVAADGSAVLAIPVNVRTPGDTRANAITGIEISVDPAPVVTDLRDARAATKRALTRRQQVPDERFALLPIVPLLPTWLVRRMISMAVGDAITASSNLGTVSPAANRPDGTEAGRFAVKMRYPRMSETTMRATGGLLSLLSGRTAGAVFISVVAYQPPDSKYDLAQSVSHVLSDFSLTGTANWRSLTAPCGSP